MILVTGATGNVGSELVRQLGATKESMRVITRDPAKVAHLNPYIERVIGDLLDDETIERAVDGVDKIYLLPLLTDTKHQYTKTLLRCAKKVCVKHLVMLSTSLAQDDSTNEIGIGHREIEKLIEQSDITWTFLHPGSFMSNCLQWRPTIVAQNKVFNPTADGKTALISPRDIAAVAAIVLTTEGHENKTYELTGPELLNVPEQVEILSSALGRSIQCIDIPGEKMADEMRRHGAPELIVRGLSSVWEEIKARKSIDQTAEIQRLTGRQAEDFAEWCHAHVSAFS